MENEVSFPGLGRLDRIGSTYALTLARFSLKNVGGSMPYVTVLPMKGNQEKTMGGSLGFLKRIWLATWRKTDSAMTPPSSMETWAAGLNVWNCWASGCAAKSCRRPIVRECRVARESRVAWAFGVEGGGGEGGRKGRKGRYSGVIGEKRNRGRGYGTDGQSENGSMVGTRRGLFCT